jgi:hypothetical protein
MRKLRLNKPVLAQLQAWQEEQETMHQMKEENQQQLGLLGAKG